MTKILFLIHDLGQGGAERVLINLVNNMNRSLFEISVTVLFGGGVNEQFLAQDIHFRAVFPRMLPGNSKLMKLLSPEQLHQLCVRGHYDIEVSYLEGPSARVISGCQDKHTKLVGWIHSTMTGIKDASVPFRGVRESERCYCCFDRIVCVSEQVKRSFLSVFPKQSNVVVLYNTVESNAILEKAQLPVPAELFQNNEMNLIAVGSMKPVKGFDRLICIHKRLRDAGYPVHTYFLGIGPDMNKLQHQAEELGQKETITFLGYQTNPYKYVVKADLFVCSSHSEGFSTAATEALIVGTPVCTVEVSGMREMLGEHNEWGVVTENSEDALFQGIKYLLDRPERLAYFKKKAYERGKMFSTGNTVRAVESMLLDQIEYDADL